MLDYTMLEEIVDAVRERFVTELPGIMSKLNRTGQLEEFLKIIDMDDLLATPRYIPYPTGKIVILGSSKVKEKELMGVAKALGIDRDRFILCLDYDETKKFDVHKMYFNSNYSLVLAGPMPHSTPGKAEYGSTIAAMEHEEGYPPIIRLGRNDLKISKSGVRDALVKAIEEGKIAC